VDIKSLLIACTFALDAGRPCADLPGLARPAHTGGLPLSISAMDRLQGEHEPLNPATLPLSAEDRDAISRVAYAEAGNQGEEGIAAVIWTILNRVLSGHFQPTVQAVIDAPNQFEPATRAGGWRNLPPLSRDQAIQFNTILNLVGSGRLPDPTEGALYFQNRAIVTARVAAGQVSPNLVDFGGAPAVAQVRDHTFYDERAYPGPGSPPNAPGVSRDGESSAGPLLVEEVTTGVGGERVLFVTNAAAPATEAPSQQRPAANSTIQGGGPLFVPVGRQAQ
jgi:cell wall hydrolase